MATLRQKKALKAIVENGGKISTGMRAAGYSPATAENPSKLTSTKGWAELLEEYLPDSKIVKALDDGIMATKWRGSFTEPDKKVEDYAVRAKYTELALKVKGKLIDKQEVSGPNGEPQKIVFEIVEQNERVKDTTTNKELSGSGTDI